MEKFRKFRNIFTCIILIFTIITTTCFVKATIGEKLTINEQVKSLIKEMTDKPLEVQNLISAKNEIPDGIALEQDGTTSEPDGATSEPDGTTSEQDGATSEQDGTTSEQDDATSEQTEKTYNVQMELNKVNQDGVGVTSGSKLKIEDVTKELNEGDETPGLEIQVFDINSGEQIQISEDKTFSTQGQGVIVELNKLVQNKKYRILIGDEEPAQGYSKTINNLKLDVQIDDQENIIASISEVEDISGKELEGLGQILAKLHGIDDKGKLTIGPEDSDSTVNIQYKIGKVIDSKDTENDGTEGNDNVEENEEWKNYDNNVTISENSTLYAKAIKKGTENEESEISFKIINNIDKEDPQIGEISKGYVSEKNNREVKITAQITDNASGIAKYGISKSEIDQPNTYKIADSALTEKDISEHRNAHPKLEDNIEIDGICENGKYYIWVWDSAGNSATKSIDVTEVHEEDVAMIVQTDDEHKSLIGKTYKSLYSALEDSPNDSSTSIKIIAEIYNENNQISNNKDITINLNGHTVNNRDTSEPNLTVNEGSSLTIVNKNDDESSSIISGSLQSENTAAILVKEGATLILRRR